jgi:dihydrofolate synthase/folylpolyglutamate synthase
MRFDEAVNYLLGLGHETLAIKLGLANIERLLAALGSPERAYPAVQIAGTNGKGSTAAMLDSICRAAGVRTGLYTSPHLVSITERIRIAGRDITREDFPRLAAEVRAASTELALASGALPTFFEQLTAIALLAFRAAGVELAILETGLGGRLDATTAARARRGRHHAHRPRPSGISRRHAAGRSPRRRPPSSARARRRRSSRVATREAREVIIARCRECRVTPRFATGDIRLLGADATGACA